MSQEHILKTWDVYWDAIERGEKLFEIRRDDRGFQKGDILILRRDYQEAVSGLTNERYLQPKMKGDLLGKAHTDAIQALIDATEAGK